MGLFDVKKDVPSTSQPVVQESTQVTELERQLQELEQRNSGVIMQIGKTFAEKNDATSAKGTPYEAMLTELAEIANEKDILEKRKLAVQGLRKCEKCGNILALDSLFCNKCGEKLEELFPEETVQGNVCRQCGTPYEEDAMFCATCGNKLTEN